MKIDPYMLGYEVHNLIAHGVICFQISCGLYELVKTSAQNVHSAAEWDIVFALVCAAGAGAWPNDRPSAAVSTSKYLNATFPINPKKLLSYLN